MRGIRNCWIKKTIVKVYVFQGGNLVMAITTDSDWVTVTDRFIDVNFEAGPSNPFLTGAFDENLPCELNITVFSGSKMMESWSVPAAELVMNSSSASGVDAKLFASDWAKTIKSKYMRC